MNKILLLKNEKVNNILTGNLVFVDYPKYSGNVDWEEFLSYSIMLKELVNKS